MKKRLIAAALAAVMIVGLASCGKKNEEKPGLDSDKVIKITAGELDEYAEESTGMWEMLQRFFSDVIVYKNSNGFAYMPIDKKIPKSDYDWDNLVTVKTDPREVEYFEKGKTISHKGIDVSSYQGKIDWEKVAFDGVEFAYVRMGYRGYASGEFATDKYFEANVKGAIQNGIGCGVYFVTRAVTEEEAVEEAKWVLANAAPYKLTWPVMLDLESAGAGEARDNKLTAEERTDIIIAFCEEIKKNGYDVILYSNISYFVDKMDLRRLTDYDKWFAQYFNRPFFPYAFQIWQYSSSGRIDGISGDVDMNISFVDYEKQ